jgi:hypothetical protein
VCTYAVNLMLRRETRRRLSRYWAAPAGIVGGLVEALFGMGGPPYVMYLAGRIAEPDAQRATISQMVILNVGLRVVAFAVAGLLVSTALWLAVAALLPVAWAGVWVGHRAHLRLAPATAARITVLRWQRRRFRRHWAAMVSEHDENEEHAQARGGHREEIGASSKTCFRGFNRRTPCHQTYVVPEMCRGLRLDRKPLV